MKRIRARTARWILRATVAFLGLVCVSRFHSDVTAVKLTAHSAGCENAQRPSPEASSQAGEGQNGQHGHPTQRWHVSKTRGIGATQVYEGPEELWLFLDVDVFEERHPYGSPPFISTPIEFHVFVLGADGVRAKYRDRKVVSGGLRAHKNFVTFFRYEDEVYAYQDWSERFYRWHKTRFELLSAAAGSSLKQELRLTGNSDDYRRLERISRRGGFRRIRSGGIGFDNYPPYEVKSERLKLRVRLERGKEGDISFIRAVAESLRPSKAWKETLLDLEGSTTP